jgi:hypothetical protein
MISTLSVSYNENCCIARKNQKSAVHLQCSYRKKNGSNFCGRHTNYLTKGLVPINIPLTSSNTSSNTSDNPENNIINKDITVMDYLLDTTLSKYKSKDIMCSCKKNKIKTVRFSLKKVRGLLINFYKTHLHCIANERKVILIQKQVRKWLMAKKEIIQGPAINNVSLCNNDSDFYSFDKLSEISKKYVITYKCNDGFIYGFHIESFIYLINDASGNPKNPYNRQFIPSHIIKKAKTLWNNLKNENSASNNIKMDNPTDIKLRVRSKCVSTFQKIDMFGYHTDVNWIINQSLPRCRSLYRSLASYWNYKAGFSPSLKRALYPMEMLLFSDREFLQMNRQLNKYVIMENLIDKIDKIVSSAFNPDDRNTGAIMVLMSMSEIIRECATANAFLG